MYLILLRVDRQQKNYKICKTYIDLAEAQQAYQDLLLQYDPDQLDLVESAAVGVTVSVDADTQGVEVSPLRIPVATETAPGLIQLTKPGEVSYDDPIDEVQGIPIILKPTQVKVFVDDAVATLQGNFVRFVKVNGEDQPVIDQTVDIPVPTAVSQLQNDSGFITNSDIPTDVSAFNNDAGYITANDIPAIPTAGEITDATSTGYAVAGDVAGALNEIGSDKQDTLISGTNIKTINNTSILGEGNIDISAPITSISVNSTTITPVSGNVDISVPTAGDITSTSSVGYAIAGEVAGALDDIDTNKQDALVSGSNIATVDGESLLSNTNISIASLGYIKNEADAYSYANLSGKPTIPTAGDITDTSSTGYAVAGEVATSLNSIGTDKQDTLVSGTNIKTINNTSVLGEGNIEIAVPITSISVNSSTISPVSGNVDISVPVAGDISTSGSAGYAVAGDVESALAGKQATLVSGTNIATIDNESLLSNTNISISNLGYIKDEANAFSYSNLSGKPTIPVAGNISDTTSTGYAVAGDVASALGDIATDKQDTLVSGTNIKTINNTSLLGSGNIDISGAAPELVNTLTTSMTVGGITSGSTYAVGTPLETLFRDLLDPIQYPTFVAPSVSLSATGSTLLEKGATQSTTFTATFSRGSITPAYGTSGYRSGPATGYSLNSGTSQEENTWTEIVSESLLAYSASASYSAGEQPKDSKGGDYDSPLSAGSVTSNTINYEFVNTLWANTSNIASVAKLPLVSINTKVKEFNFPAATVANPEIFDVPAAWTVTAVEVLNTLNNQWETCITEFSVTDTTHNDAGGTSTAYKRYTCNLGYDMGNRKVRVKWA